MSGEGRRSIGDQEMALLRFVVEHGPLSVGQAAESFGGERGLARSTVLTMMERLRKKGFVRRQRAGGVFRYAAQANPEELLQGAVRDFVANTLSGSVSPFVSYLAQTAELSEAELAELERLVAELQSRRKES
jgi:predicted transcriptional regulator